MLNVLVESHCVKATSVPRWEIFCKMRFYREKAVHRCEDWVRRIRPFGRSKWLLVRHNFLFLSDL